MDNNELNRRIRYSLQLDDADAVTMMQLAGVSATSEEAASWRIRTGEPGFEACPKKALIAMLDGLILDRRGPPSADAAADGPPDTEASAGKTVAADRYINNAVLKQLRIALSLRSDGVHELILAGGGKLAKNEVGAFFRKPDARNFRVCGDQVLRWFLAGVAQSRDVS